MDRPKKADAITVRVIEPENDYKTSNYDIVETETGYEYHYDDGRIVKAEFKW